MHKSLLQLQAKISSGELKAKVELPKDATPEQMAEFRKTNDLPATAEAYVEKLALPDGVVIGEADKPLVASFAKSMFEAGATQGEMNRAVSWFYQQQEAVEAQRAETDVTGRTKAQGELMGEWGPGDFKTNMNAVGSLLSTMPEALKTSLLTARTADGRMVGDTAEFNRWAAATAREINPAATLIPANVQNQPQVVATEIAAIEAKMYLPNGEANPEYWKGAGGEALQARYRELTDAQQKMSARGKAA